MGRNKSEQHMGRRMAKWKTEERKQKRKDNGCKEEEYKAKEQGPKEGKNKKKMSERRSRVSGKKREGREGKRGPHARWEDC